jgi:hypothetical protein
MQIFGIHIMSFLIGAIVGYLAGKGFFSGLLGRRAG